MIGFALPGDFLGTMPSDRYGYSADAIDSVSVCRLSREAFAHFIEQRPHFLIRINEFTARELMLAQEQMLLLGRRTAEEKVASFLVGWRERLAHIGDERPTIALPMNRQDIADYLGLTIENREPDTDPVRARENAHHRRRRRPPAGSDACGSHGCGLNQAQRSS